MSALGIKPGLQWGEAKELSSEPTQQLDIMPTVTCITLLAVCLGQTCYSLNASLLFKSKQCALQVRYICGAKGCRTYGDPVTDDEDILVLRRQTQTVRAVDARSGAEKYAYIRQKIYTCIYHMTIPISYIVQPLQYV